MKEITHQENFDITTGQDRRQLFLRYLNRAWLIIGIVTLVTLPIFPQHAVEFIWVMTITFPTYLIVRFLNLSGRTRLAGSIYMIIVDLGFYILFLVLVRQLGTEKAFETQATVWMLMGLAVLLAGALVNKWAAPLVAMFNTILLIATRIILSPSSEPRPSVLIFWWMLAIIIWLYEGTLSNALERVIAELAERKKTENELFKAYDATIEGWSKAMDLRDKETEGHTKRVTETALKLAQALNIPKGNLIHLRRGGLLHDMGKLGVPDYILYKADKLTDEEWQVMRKHPQFAYDMLYEIQYIQPALEIPYCHHEKWDGTGYPRKLAGEDIPLSARIFAVVDVWDALTSDRPYRKAWTKEQALAYIREQSGRHFDPQVARTFLKMIDQG